MTLVLLLLSVVTLAVVVLAGVVVSRAAAGHGLEDELVTGAEREPWAAEVDRREPVTV